MDLISIFNLVVIVVLLTLVTLMYMKIKKISKNNKFDIVDKNNIPLFRVNIPTRGETTEYREIGVVSNGNRLLKLMGREIYSGSSKFQYYALSDQFNSTRLTVIKNGRECDDSNGCDELYDGDMLTVPDISNTLKFKVNIHDNLDRDKLRYIPYIANN